MSKPRDFLTIHHSLADWDFMKLSDWSPVVCYSLDNSRYITPPYSLAFGDWHYDVIALLNHPKAWDLKEGRISTYACRSLAGLGRALMNIGVTGPADEGFPFAICSTTNEWWRARVEWWQGIDPHCQPCTWWLKEIWRPSGAYSFSYTHAAPMTGTTNRVGISVRNQSLGVTRWFDNTIIEIPASAPHR